MKEIEVTISSVEKHFSTEQQCVDLIGAREGGKKLFLYPFRFCTWSLQINLTKGRWTGKNA